MKRAISYLVILVMVFSSVLINLNYRTDAAVNGDACSSNSDCEDLLVPGCLVCVGSPGMCQPCPSSTPTPCMTTADCSAPAGCAVCVSNVCVPACNGTELSNNTVCCNSCSSSTAFVCSTTQGCCGGPPYTNCCGAATPTPTPTDPCAGQCTNNTSLSKCCPSADGLITACCLPTDPCYQPPSGGVLCAPPTPTPICPSPQMLCGMTGCCFGACCAVSGLADLCALDPACVLPSPTPAGMCGTCEIECVTINEFDTNPNWRINRGCDGTPSSQYVCDCRSSGAPPNGLFCTSLEHVGNKTTINCAESYAP
ncbi:MAG: hypothetical protein A3B68_00320 [Candidatus Melainabacteria bacterium RIFCSPHIGHO2_02_FULL_34_12]|nr:MAG: hypothetical protein A3B68_00320 [Candidatus Melainabacteria bacterium RIFCSPHIGHO2_02_FULL_34_12]